MVSFHSEVVKPVTQKPDRSRPSSVKCVGHFGSVRTGGTESNSSLEGKCDRASLPTGFNVLTQTEGESRGRGGERQMAQK